MFRVLKPGGRVAVSDIALKKPLPAELGQDVARLRRLHRRGHPRSPTTSGMLREAGFAAVQVVDTGKDLNAYAQVESGSGCCGARRGCAAPCSQPPAAAPCTTATTGRAARPLRRERVRRQRPGLRRQGVTRTGCRNTRRRKPGGDTNGHPASLRPPDVLLDRASAARRSTRCCPTSPPTWTGSRTRASRSSGTTWPSSRRLRPHTPTSKAALREGIELPAAGPRRWPHRLPGASTRPARCWPRWCGVRVEAASPARGRALLRPDGLLLKGRCVMEFLERPTRNLFFTGKGGVGKTSRGLCRGRRPGRRGQAGAAGQHRPGVATSTRCSASTLAATPDAGPRRARTCGR